MMRGMKGDRRMRKQMKSMMDVDDLDLDMVRLSSARAAIAIS